MHADTTCAGRLERAAARGAAFLSERAATRVAAWLLSRIAPDGGFRARDGASDLYYSYFALAALRALDQPAPRERTQAFLASFGDGRGLDLVHLSCLVRCLAMRSETRSDALVAAAGLASFLSAGGGYRPTRDGERGSIAASFVALLACEALGLPLPGRDGILDCISCHRSADGAWADVPGLEHGTTTTTAAVVLVAAAEGGLRPGSMRPLLRSAIDWLCQRSGPSGGFVATVGAPGPDLLSTAAALLALQATGASLRPFAPATLELVGELWSEEGGFRGHPRDPVSDTEFTYYALVALGAISGELP